MTTHTWELAEIERLRAEIDRLRAALKTIAQGTWNKSKVGLLDVHQFARHTLEPRN